MEQSQCTFRYTTLKTLADHLLQSKYTALCYFNSFPFKDGCFFRRSSPLSVVLSGVLAHSSAVPLSLSVVSP